MNVQNPTDSAAAVAGGSCTLARAPGSKRVNQKKQQYPYQRRCQCHPFRLMKHGRPSQHHLDSNAGDNDGRKSGRIVVLDPSFFQTRSNLQKYTRKIEKRGRGYLKRMKRGKTLKKSKLTCHATANSSKSELS